MGDYYERLRLIKLGQLPKEYVAKAKKPIAKKSAKRIEEDRLNKEALNGDDTLLQKWFDARHKEMVGICQCGCGEKTSKHDIKHFRSCICHIFPQRLFPSVQYHKLNWVERKFWATNGTSACHTNMDLQSMDKWVNFADWDDIVDKFHVLVPLLTDEERATKFYSHLESLIYGKRPTLSS